MSKRIFTVPPGVAFLPALARAILAGDLPSPSGKAPDPLTLPDITLSLPTRRAVRAAQDAFLAASGARALLMPRIRPISDGEDDLTLLTRLATPAALGAEALELPEPIPALERTLLLMQLVQRWRETLADQPDGTVMTNTAAQAAGLAIELASLMDEVERENVAFEKIHDLVPDTYSEHWKKTVDFLKIVSTFKSLGLTSEVELRNTLIRSEARRLETNPPKTPVIVAGVTGSIPATVTLMRAVAALPNGAIVLPALDLSMDDASWQAIAPADTQQPAHPEHPQFGLKRLLDQLGVDRREVQVLAGAKASTTTTARNAFISEAMRPSATTEQWHAYTSATAPDKIKSALTGVSLIEAPSAQDEAEAVALILREAVETPGRTAALVSPDRLLARRVAIRLEAWGIRVDDSAGRPFAKTVPGTFLNLIAGAVVSDFAPADVMALLKHPLCRLGLKAFDVRRFGRALEIAAFRAPYLGRGLEGVAAALRKCASDRLEKKRRHRAAERLWDDDLTGAADLVARLAIAFEPLSALYERPGQHAFAAFAKAHSDTAERLAELDAEDPGKQPDANPIWQGDAGAAANTFFRNMIDPSLPEIKIKAADYADLYQSLLARENVREHTAVHPRVTIWGASEARLQQPDVLVLGSLNEGTWPKAAETGAWLNRPMRQALGLPSPEEETGRAAHDFISLLGADRVYLTRAQKVKGVPTVPSRWLMRITALLDGFKLKSELATEQRWLAWARARDAIDKDGRIKIQAPDPAPPVAVRPRKMSVTRVEEWITNPYAVYARHILELEPLPALGMAPDQSLRGALVHDVLSRFASQHPEALPPNARAVLNRIAIDLLADLTGHPRVAAFWMPRLQRFLDWFAATEPARREGVGRVVAEVSGALVLAAPSGPFTLTARADRIDDATGGLIITDYKTGGIPSAGDVREGRASQLPLEAAIATDGAGFPNVAARPVQTLRYIRASGGEPAGEEKTIDTKSETVAALAARAVQGLSTLVALYDIETTPYRAIRRPGFRYDYDDYAHLARVAEWSAHAEDEGSA